MNASTFYLSAYGLTLVSSHPLPHFQLSNEPSSQRSADVEIIQQEVCQHGLSQCVEQGLFWQANQEALWLNVPNIARFLIRDGQTIFFDPEPGIDNDSLAAFLMGPCLAALLIQRDLFVLSGCVVKVDDTAVAYLGEGCSGKSSILGAMMQKRYLVLADNLCVLNQQGLVFPGPNYMELWHDSATKLGLIPEELQPIRPQFKKYRLPLAPYFYQHPLPLKQVYALHPQKKEGLGAKRLTGGDKINFLQKNIYNKNYVSGFKKNPIYFNYCAQLAQQLTMHLIEFDGLSFDIEAISNALQGLQEASNG